MARQPLFIEVGGKTPKNLPSFLNIEVPHPLLAGRIDVFQTNCIKYNSKLSPGEVVIHWDNGKQQTLKQ